MSYNFSSNLKQFCDYFVRLQSRQMPVSEIVKYLLRLVSMPLYITVPDTPIIHWAECVASGT